MALQRSLSQVRKDLRGHQTYRMASQATQKSLDGVFSGWNLQIDEALKAAGKSGSAKPQLLMDFFPAATTDSKLIGLSDSTEEADPNHRSSWETLYDQALAPRAEKTGQLVHLPDEAAGLRRAVLENLSLRFPSAFAAVVKAPEFEASRKAYQKLLLIETLRAVRRLPVEFKEGLESLDRKLDDLASSPVGSRAAE